MSLQRFLRCLAVTLVFEGGKVNHPKDPGGRTNKGVTQRVYDRYRDETLRSRRSVYLIDDAEVQAIYRTGYWNTVRGDTLHAGVDLSVFDYGVNSGPQRAVKALLAVMGGTDIQTIKALNAQRMRFVRGLKTFSTFGKGWRTRIAGIEAKSIAWSLQASGTTTAQVKDQLALEGKIAVTHKKAAEAQSKTAAGGAAASGGATQIIPGDSDQLAVWALMGGMVLACVVLIVMIHRVKNHAARAYAFEQEGLSI